MAVSQPHEAGLAFEHSANTRDWSISGLLSSGSILLLMALTARRTKVALLYKKTGNLRACQLLLGHTKLESTVRYLGVEVDDALELSEALEL